VEKKAIMPTTAEIGMSLAIVGGTSDQKGLALMINYDSVVGMSCGISPLRAVAL